MKFAAACLAVFICSCSGEKPTGGNTNSVPNNVEVPKKGELVRAIASNDVTRVKGLLDQNADVNENVGSDIDRVTPLLVAAAQGNDEITKLILSKSPKLFHTYHGFSARDFATHHHRGESSPNSILVQLDGGKP